MNSLSLMRPLPLPAKAARGRIARELRFDSWNDHPGYGLTPDRVVSIYRLAEQGYPQQQCDLFDDIRENDGTLRNLLESRINSVSGAEWSIESDGAEGDSELAAQLLGHALSDMPMVDVFNHQLDFNAIGWAVSEIDWDVRVINGRRWVVPVWFANVPARRFYIDPVSDTLSLVTSMSGASERLDPGKWWVSRRSSSRLARSGLLRTATWLALWKRHGTRDWVVYAEKFGIPLILAKYDSSEEDEAKDVAIEIVENIGNDGGAAVPKSVQVEIVEAGRGSDSSATHGNLIEFCNREMAKLINGATLSNDNSQSGGASYALGEVHASLRWQSVLSDAKRIQETFRTHVAAPFVAFNGLTARAPLLKMQVVQDQSPRDLLDAAVRLRNEMSVPISISQLRRLTGLHAPIGTGDEAPGLPMVAPAVNP